MKTIKPIEIQAKKNEKLIQLAKRAINNAYCNCSMVRLIVDGVECLVYPNDNLGKVIHYVKLHLVLNKLSELEASN
jgi:hypothetical protein